MNGRAPGPLLAYAGAACALAFATDHPLIIAALALLALAFHLSSPRRRRMYVVAGLVIGAGIALLNPFVQANGDLILFELPDIPLFDMQVTFEEVVRGVVMGARAFAVTVIIGAALTQADPDRLLALAARLLPRSALAASIAARMMPALAHDARALADTARLRGRSLRHGTWRHRAGTAGALAVPLVGSSLERSLDVAQAMAARGYGAGPRTRLPEPRATRGEITLAALAAPLALLAGLAIAGVVGAYSFYPTLDPMTAPADVAAALAVVAVTAVATLAGRR